MDEKKSIKVSLGTVICIFIIILLAIALGGMYYYYNYKNVENTTRANNENVKEQNSSEISVADNYDIEKLINNYILTQFGPQNNMKNVTVDSYKEITAEEYFAKNPGGPLTEEEKTEYLKKDLIYGYCTYTIELIDANKLSMAGSKPAYQEIVGNNFKSEAIFTLNKKTHEIKFVTSYGFANKQEDVSTSVNKSYKDIAGFYTAKVKLNDNSGEEAGYYLYLWKDGTYNYRYSIYASSGTIGNYIIENNVITLNKWFTTGSDITVEATSGDMKIILNSDGTLTDTNNLLDANNTDLSKITLKRDINEEQKKQTQEYYSVNDKIHTDGLRNEHGYVGN